MNKENTKEYKKARLLGSLLLFTQYFYEKRTGRQYELSNPVSQESHYIQMARFLTNTVKNPDYFRSLINIPPRYGKTEMLIHYVAWTLARYPSSNYLYVSFAKSVAEKQTRIIREIVTMPDYQNLFGFGLSSSVRSKHDFETTEGGAVYAAGLAGSITSRGAGIQSCKTFGGALIIDDIHKPDEVASDTSRNRVLASYKETLASRTNDPSRTPIIFIGQRLHEDDLPNNLLEGYDGNEWKTLILPSLNKLDQALHPGKHSAEQLKKMRKHSPYVFFAQYQQNPTSPGDGLFKREWFPIKDEMPKMLSTFITCDSAETEQTYNDATVFSFWGLYRIKLDYEIDIDMYGLHWIDCHELRVEPRDLQAAFLNFYAGCMRFPVKPKYAAIEKKSTGTTLCSVLKDMQGLHIIEVERTKASGSKSTRFIQIQSYVASKRVSISSEASHKEIVLAHMEKITANGAQRFDDIADTLTDGIQLGLIDKVIPIDHNRKNQSDRVLDMMAQTLNKRLKMGESCQFKTLPRNT